MENRRLDEDITAGFGDYLTQKEQQYSRELSEVRSHLQERVKEVKTDLEKDIREVKTDIKADLWDSWIEFQIQSDPIEN